MERTWKQELAHEAIERMISEFGFKSIEVSDVRAMTTATNDMFISIIADDKVYTGVGNSINNTVGSLCRNARESINSPTEHYLLEEK